MARELTFDLLAKDNASRPIRKVGDAFDDTAKKVRKFNDAGDEAGKSNDKLDKSTRTLASRFEGLGGKIGAAALSAGRFASLGGAAASIAVPLAGALAHGAIAAAQFGASVAPAAAALLPLAAGAILAKTTLTALAPAMLKALSPISSAFAKATKSASALAVKGVGPLSKQFVKANFPAISNAMNHVAIAANRVTIGFLHAASVGPGLKSVHAITSGLADTMDKLSPLVSDLSQSLLNLAGRAAKPAFAALQSGATGALTKITSVVDGISGADIQNAFGKLSHIAGQAAHGMHLLGDGLVYLDTHREALNRFADSVAAASIVIGLATGPVGWVSALISAAGLIFRHWDQITGVFDKVRGSFAGVGGVSTAIQPTLHAFADVWAAIKSGVSSFVDEVRPKLGPFLVQLRSAFINIQPALAGMVEALGPLIKALLVFAGLEFGALIQALGFVINAFGIVVHAASKMAAGVLGAFADMLGPVAGLAQKLHLPLANAFAATVDSARAASRRINDSLKAVDTAQAQLKIDQLKSKVASLKGKKVKTEADKAAIAASIAEIRRLQAKIDATHGKTVYVTTVNRQIQRNPGYKGNPATGGQKDGGLIRRHFAGGGYNGMVPLGLGGPRQDNVPAWLSSGEFVINAASVRKYGTGTLGAINAGTAPVGGGTVNVVINMPPGSDGRDVVKAIQTYERRNGKGWRSS